MKSDRLSKYLKGWTDSISALFGRRTRTEFSNPRRYRLDFIAENTFNRVWTLRFNRAKVFIFAATIIAAIAALMFVVIFFTPVRKLLPGQLEGDLRSRYVDMALRLDSLEQLNRANDRYVNNLRSVLTGSSPAVAPAPERHISELTAAQTDSMLQASDAERRFVEQYEASERFNLSVLTPIAAEGMAFYSPVDGAVDEPALSRDNTLVEFAEKGLLAISSAYRGTVIGVYPEDGGLSTVVIQHPNDFISIYHGLAECFTRTGSKVRSGERIGHSGKDRIFGFELWHNGSAVNPTEYIGF